MKTSLKITVLAVAVAALPYIGQGATAEENWTLQCKKCHAADGSASGPIGHKLKLKDYTKADVQAAMTDADMTKAIKGGEKDETTGKMTMPAYGEKLSDTDIAALVALIRTMKK